MEEQRDENLRVIQHVIAAFTQLEIPYALGGSWASSFHGRVRMTHDADFTAEPFPGKEAAFCRLFGPDYYISLPAVQDALARRSSFNIIHLPSSFKADVFVRKERPFDCSVMKRSAPHALPDHPDKPIVFVSAEDIVLLKLDWYRLGGETSERQWLDVVEVMKTQGDRLDQAYLDYWGAELKLADLLARARAEAGS
jgi:hypothetical protein